MRDKIDQAEQALRILDTLEEAKFPFKVARVGVRWVVSVTLGGEIQIVSGKTLADALAQLAQAVTT